jgi:hypothetical protein
MIALTEMAWIGMPGINQDAAIRDVRLHENETTFRLACPIAIGIVVAYITGATNPFMVMVVLPLERAWRTFWLACATSNTVRVGIFFVTLITATIGRQFTSLFALLATFDVRNDFTFQTRIFWAKIILVLGVFA